MTSNKEILIIHRDELFLAKITPVLQACGYTIHAAKQMRNALSALATHPVGLIVCDKDLEDISGIEFLTFIKNDPLRESIPFMFLVSLKNQCRPFEALSRGAVDYLVYPLDARTLVARIGEAFRPVAEEKSNSVASAARPVVKPAARATKTVPPALTPPPTETPPRKAARPPAETSPPKPDAARPLIVEVSRDGIIWMPSKIKTVTTQSIAVVTSLFGKTGVALMVRFTLPDGIFVVNGHIKSIVFKDFQKPADIDIAVFEDDTWRRIHAGLTQGWNAEPFAPASEAPGAAETPGSADIGKTIALADILREDSDITVTQLQLKAGKKKSSYDSRFYHSLIGKQLDNYRVITLIGAGNMGGVMQGWDVALEREVALKIISFELSSKEEFKEMFIREARVVSKLNHPNIAQIYNIGTSNEILYYAMEFIDGITLKDLIRREGRLNILKGLAILMTLCKALEFIYQSGIVHRDIKPANIMINNAGVIKLLDFGVAHKKDSKISGKNLIAGTPLYMSPEQISGLTLDHRSDMYSLGATFYHAFCGAPPFDAEEIKDILGQHLGAPIVPLCEKDGKIPSQLSNIIEKMMAKDPNHRYQSFKEIADELNLIRTRLFR